MGRADDAPFVAVDGEAIGQGTDTRYALLAASTGRHVVNVDGLDTVSCLEFLLDLPKHNLVCFGLNYDANQWLRDLDNAALVELWRTQRCLWRDYRIRWLPGRWLDVKHVDGRYRQVTEVFGFFQSSFVSALDAWGISPPAELAAMKKRRGQFTAADMRRTINYCRSECQLLADLMGRVRDACRDAGAMPQRWIGAGSIANALLHANSVQPHHCHDAELCGATATGSITDTGARKLEAVMGAYFAGRIELLGQGIFAHAHTRDLRSAYPAAATHLPSLAGATLRYRRRYDPTVKHGIWRARWQGLNGTVLMPFPCRHDQQIYYPASGDGTYHACEIAAALAAGYDVQVLDGYELVTRDNHQPFLWIDGLYRERRRLAQAGHPAQKVLKLGLNSVYGKIAQGYGFKSRPPWQSYFWAGEITARTRASLLTAASKARQPIMLATDGIFARGLDHVRQRADARLGSWEAGAVSDLFAAQAGVYHGHADDGHEILKSRGFFARDIDYDELRAGYEREGFDFVLHYTSHRFHGLGASLRFDSRGRLRRFDRDLWLSWADVPRAIDLHPQRKQITPQGVLLPWHRPVSSQPYEPKESLLDQAPADHVQGLDQPLREGM